MAVAVAVVRLAYVTAFVVLFDGVSRTGTAVAKLCLGMRRYGLRLRLLTFRDSKNIACRTGEGIGSKEG